MNSRESSWQKYPHYHRCDTSWLGTLPNHWALRRLKSCAIDVADLTNHRNRDDVYVALEHVEGWTGKITEPDEEATFESQVKRFKAGDILFGKLRPYLAKVAQPKRDGVCVGEFLVLRPHAGVITSDYLERLTRSKPVINAIDASTFGAKMPRADWHFMGNMALPLPPLNEQAAIVRYLDHTDELISRYIGAKEQLIALLEEQRQAVIHETVTRGLDPNVRLKPSAVEWLGDVPAHWEVERLKAVLQPIDRRSVTGSETLLSLRRDHGVVAYDEHFTRPSQSRSLVGYKLVTTGQLVLNRLQANNGLIFNSNLDGLVSPDYSVFENKSPLRMQFVSDLLRTIPYRTHFRQRSTGLGTGTAGFLRLYDDKFLETKVHLPPVQEQVAIIEHINQADANINAAISHARRQVDLLREYRTRLIADAVTGQIDVRDAAIDLPN